MQHTELQKPHAWPGTPRAKMIEAWTLSSIEPSLLTWVSLVMVGMQTSPILLDVRKSTWSTRSYWSNTLNHFCPLQIQQRVMSSISFKSSTAICHSPAFSQAEIAALKQMTSGDTCRIVESWSFWGDPWKQKSSGTVSEYGTVQNPRAKNWFTTEHEFAMSPL